MTGRQWLLAGKPDARGKMRTAKLVHLWIEDGPALCGYKRWNVRPNRTPTYIESDGPKCPKCSAALDALHAGQALAIILPEPAPTPRRAAPAPAVKVATAPAWDVFVESTPDLPLDLEAAFDRINAAYFDNEVPKIQVTWNRRLSSAAGRCFSRNEGEKSIPLRIDLASRLLDTPEKVLRTLAHEMVHAWLYATQPRSIAKGHGPMFQAKMRSITGEGGSHTYHEYDTSKAKRWIPVCPTHGCKANFGPRTRRSRNAKCPHCSAKVEWNHNPHFEG